MKPHRVHDLIWRLLFHHWKGLVSVFIDLVVKVHENVHVVDEPVQDEIGRVKLMDDFMRDSRWDYRKVMVHIVLFHDGPVGISLDLLCVVYKL